MNGLTAGRMVHFVMSEPYAHYQPDHLAAVVTEVNDDSGNCDLSVFTGLSAEPVKLYKDIPFSEEPHIYTWHWIEKA